MNRENYKRRPRPTTEQYWLRMMNDFYVGTLEYLGFVASTRKGISIPNWNILIDELGFPSFNMRLVL
jgi:hypothetical protein